MKPTLGGNVTWKSSDPRNRQPEVWRAPVHTRWLVAGVILMAFIGIMLIRLGMKWFI